MTSFLDWARQGQARWFSHIDWFLFLAALSISLLGLATMRSFSLDNGFFDKQIIWIVLAVCVFYIASLPDYGFLRRTSIVAGLYVAIIVLMSMVLSFGVVVKGDRIVSI